MQPKETLKGWGGGGLTGVEVKTPSPRKLFASKPCTPPSNAACAAGPPSGYFSFSSGASAMYRESCGGMISICEGRARRSNVVQDRR